MPRCSCSLQQRAAGTHVPGIIIMSSRRLRAQIVFGVAVYDVLVQYVWLNYATHAIFWVPYQMASPFEVAST